MPSCRARGRSGPALDRRRRTGAGQGPAWAAMVVAARQSLREPAADRPLRAAIAPQLGFVAGLALHEAVADADGNWRAAPGAEMAERSAARRRQGVGPAPRGAPGRRRRSRLPSSSGSASTSSNAPTGTPYPTVALQKLVPDLPVEDTLRGAVRQLCPHLRVLAPGRAQRRHPIRSGRSAVSGSSGPPASAAIGDRAPALPARRSGIFEGLDPRAACSSRTASGVGTDRCRRPLFSPFAV